MSHNEASLDNNTCGRLKQPCHSFPYAQQIAGHGDTIALDRNYEFHVNHYIATVVGRDLDLTSYCVEDSCANRKTATVTFEYVYYFFSISSSNNVKLSQLHLNVDYGEAPNTLFLLQEGIASVKMKDCIVTTYAFSFKISYEYFPYKSHFETIEIQNVVFVGKSYKPYKPPFFSKSNSLSHSICLNITDPPMFQTPRTLQSKNDHRTKPGNFSRIIITKTFFQDLTLELYSNQYFQSHIFNMHQNTFNNSLLSFYGSTKCVINITSNRHYGSPISFVSTSPSTTTNLTIMIKNLTSTYFSYDNYYLNPQLNIDMDKVVVGSSVSLHNCTFSDLSNISAVTIIKISEVSISHTIFRNINVTDISQLSTSSAAGLTLLSSRVVLMNCSFVGVSTLQNFPSSLYVQILQDNHQMPLLNMTNLLFETSTFQNWDDDLVWYLKVESAFLVRQNVTIRCLKGDQQFKITESENAKIFYCTRCNTSSYNILPPTMKWEENSTSVESNNECHQPCPYQASCGNGLKSRGNYWGLIKEGKSLGTVSFFLCPTFYCCSSKRDCLSYDTCANNRRGRLCGDCNDNHSIALFGPNQCVLTEDCEPNVFWAGYVLMILVVFVLVLYYKDIFLYIGKLISKIKNRWRKRSLERQFKNRNRSSVLEPFLKNENEAASEENKKNSYNKSASVSQQISGLIKLAFFFYQVAAIIRIEASAKMNFQTPVLIEILTSFFNIKMSSSKTLSPNHVINVCPLATSNVFLIELFRVSIILWCLLFLLLSTSFLLLLDMISKIMADRFPVNIKVLSRKTGKRIKAGIVQLLLLGFSSISSICLESVHCIKIEDHGWFLYKQAATVKCYQTWQNFVNVFIGVWVVLFPFTLYLGTLLLSLKRMTPNWFLVLLIFPPSIIVFLVFVNESCFFTNEHRHETTGALNDIDVDGDDFNDNTNDIDTERSAILLVINEPFRVLHRDDTKEGEEEEANTSTSSRSLIWEPVLLYRRLILLCASIFIVNPMLKLYPIGVLLALFAMHDYLVKPFSDETKLNLVQTASSGLLGVLALINTFWAFSNNFDLTAADETFHMLGWIFLYFELTVLLLPLIVVLCWLLHRAIVKLYKLCLRKQD